MRKKGREKLRKKGREKLRKRGRGEREIEGGRERENLRRQREGEKLREGRVKIEEVRKRDQRLLYQKEGNKGVDFLSTNSMLILWIKITINQNALLSSLSLPHFETDILQAKEKIIR